MKNKLFRITESDVHNIMENVIRRIITENYYSQSSILETWMDVVNKLGPKDFVDFIYDKGYDESLGGDWDIEDVFDELESQGLDREMLGEIEDNDLISLMQDRLSQGLQLKILQYIDSQVPNLGLTDDVKDPNETYVDVERFNDKVDNEVVSSDEEEVEDDEEPVDSEFIGMDDYED